ncbi:hypothetical protein [Marseilla massiliensis]|uniref:Uncharacterized protein n=1 Tax=Marseilla massiliensis TaxID=1841864 RepID=A0A938WSG6_9BACT|nr:hypothetical protein [Marseilla massiliensis]MBM6672921.1 hypothetical protein [Marseilla massiliensis]
MKVVTTKAELEKSLKQKEKSIIVKGYLAVIMKKIIKTSIIISVAFVVVILTAIFFMGWSSAIGFTIRFAVHIVATLALLVGVIFISRAMRKGIL